MKYKLHEKEEDILEELDDLLDAAEENLQEAIENLLEFSKLSNKLKGLGNISGRIQSYILGHLKDWINNKNQISSIASLREELRKYEEWK